MRNKDFIMKLRRMDFKFIMSVFIVFLIAACSNSSSKLIENISVEYICSMHPQVIRSKPGKCPICQMELIAVIIKKSGDNNQMISLSQEQVNLGEISVTKVRTREFGQVFSVIGIADFDQTKLFSQSAKITGRIDHLYIKDIGEYINKGSKILDLYSEELNTAKSEYVLAYKKQHTSQKGSFDYSSLVENAKNKLILWGMSENQIKELPNKPNNQLTTFYSDESGYVTEINVKEGVYVSEGNELLKLADLSTIWIDAELFSSQLNEIKSAINVIISNPNISDKKWKGKIELINPEVANESRINIVRIKVDNKEELLRPGMGVYVTVSNKKKQVLAVPTSALLRLKDKVVVWIQVGVNRFMQKTVEIGEENDSITVVTSGLKEGDQIVVTGAYLIQSEFIFKKGSSDKNGMKQMKM